jgi:hypothetical protein
MTKSKRALEGSNRVLQSLKPANAKTPQPRKLNHNSWYRKWYPAVSPRRSRATKKGT